MCLTKAGIKRMVNGNRQKARPILSNNLILEDLRSLFFGPFYGGYNIIELDKKDYSYSMITGPNKSYFWILSQTRQLPKATMEALIKKAKQLGFATDKLIFANQD
jgi:apolipoprotein D and lipocalin family protein